MATAHLLNPVDGPPSPLHVAYLDDVNIRLPGRFDAAAAAAAQVDLVERRLAGGGLQSNRSKALVVAGAGHTFDAHEREMLKRMGMPCVDASTPAKERGFVTVGVPVGCSDFVLEYLQSRLLSKPLWQLAWQLAGMAEHHMQAALLIFRRSFTRRMSFLLRCVDPSVGTTAFACFDSLCVWTLERMLHLRGAATAEEMRSHLARVCMDVESTDPSAAGDDKLVLSSLGPTQLSDLNLPIRLARTSSRNGGLGLAHLRQDSHAAYLAQTVTTMPQRVRTLFGTTAPAGLVGLPLVREVQGACRALLQYPSVWQHLPSSLLQWAEDESPSDAATLSALTDTRIDPAVVRARASGAADSLTGAAAGDDDDDMMDVDPEPTTPFSSGHQTSAAPSRPQRMAGRQSRLTALIAASAAAEMQRELEEAGAEGKEALAQRRSQSGRAAMAWLEYLQVKFSVSVMTTMLLQTLLIDGWRVSGVECPYKCSDKAMPTCVHAMGCRAQHLRGHNAVHTCMKRCLQQLLREHGVTDYVNEDKSMFFHAERSADTAVQPGGLCLSGHAEFAHKGIVLDTSVRACTAARYINPVRRSAANVDGYAAEVGDDNKENHHFNKFTSSRWVLVPFIQESFGRLGEPAAAFVKALAAHSAACGGGSVREIARRKSRIVVDIRARLASTLAREEGERIMSWVRGATMLGRRSNPVSSLLSHCAP